MFQDVVALLHRHLDDSASFEDSAMLLDRDTGAMREVDLLVTRQIAGQTVSMAVESSRTARPADVNWIEQMLAKHSRLETDKLVLVSSAGFSKSASVLAHKNHVAILSELPLSDTALAAALDGLARVYLRRVKLTPSTITATLGVPETCVDIVNFDETALVYDRSGVERGTIRSCAHSALAQLVDEANKSAGELAAGTSTRTNLTVAIEPVSIMDGDSRVQLYLLGREIDSAASPHLYELLKIVVECERVVDVLAFDLRQSQIGCSSVSYGESTVDGQPARVVASVTDGTEKLTIRFKPGADEEDIAFVARIPS